MPTTRSLIALLSTVALAGCGQSNSPIVVGLAASLSDPVGTSIRLGAELAVAEINGRGGVRGRTIELVPTDDFGLADTAVQVAQRYIDNDAVVAVVGHSSSVTSLAAAPIYGSGDNPVPTISPSASSSEFRGASPYFFRVCPDDDAHAAALADGVRNQFGIRNVAVLYRNDPENRGAASAFRREFIERGGRILSDDPFSQALPSFEPYLIRATTRGGIQALLVLGGGPSLGRIIATVDSLGIRPVILGKSDLLNYSAVGEISLQGAILSAAYVAGSGGARDESFVVAFRLAHDGQFPDVFAAGAFDVVNLIARAIDEVGPRRSEIRDYLAGVGTETEPFEGATGSIAFDEQGNLRNANITVGIVQDGTLLTDPERQP